MAEIVFVLLFAWVVGLRHVLRRLAIAVVAGAVAVAMVSLPVAGSASPAGATVFERLGTIVPEIGSGLSSRFIIWTRHERQTKIAAVRRCRVRPLRLQSPSMNIDPTNTPIHSQFPSADQEDVLDLRAFWTVIVRGWWVFVLGILVAGSATWFLSSVQTPLYTATASILVEGGRTPGTPSAGDLQASQQLAQSYVGLVTTRPILAEVAAALRTPDDTAGPALQISVSSAGSLIVITATHPSPGSAAKIANTTAGVFIDDTRRRQFTRIAQFQASLSQYGIAEDPTLVAAQAATLTSLSIIEEAEPPSSPSTPRTRRSVLLAAFVGLLIAGLILIVREFLDDRVKSPEQLRNMTSVLTGERNPTSMPTMGSVTRFPGTGRADTLIFGDHTAGDLTEAYKFLQTNLEFAAVGASRLNSLLVTSSSPEEGKTTTAANLGISMAREGKTVIVVDGDLRRPDMHRLFHLKEQKGLTHLLLGTGTVDEAAGPTEIEGLRIVPSGPLPPDPVQVLRSPRMREVVAELQAKAEMVIFDSPPLLAVTDPMLIAPLVDGVLLVVDAGRTRRNQLRRSVEMLRLVDPPMVGAVLNKVKARGHGYDGYSSYYYRNRSDDGRDGSIGWIQALKGTALVSKISGIWRRARRRADSKGAAPGSEDRQAAP